MLVRIVVARYDIKAFFQKQSFFCFSFPIGNITVGCFV